MQEAKLTPATLTWAKFGKAGLAAIDESSGLAAQSLRPSCEGVPGGGLADGGAYLLYDDQEGAGPNGGAMSFACGLFFY